MADELRGLEKVRLDRQRLLETIKENRDNHRRLFEEAMEGYRKKSIQLLEEHIQRIKDNAPEQVFINLPMPEDHTDDYETVIAMLEWTEDAYVLLTQQEFKRYVLDEWGWQQDFAESYALYTKA